MSPAHRVAALLSAVAVSTVLAGCAGSGSTTSPGTGLPAATGAERLADVCPATVVVQQNWEPEAEYAGVYALVGPGYTIDADRKRLSGPLVIDGRDTGVRIEVRAGGAAIGFAAISAQMYVDKSITLGMVGTDSAIKTSANQPVTAVISQLQKSPQMLMWDPMTHPSWTGIADIGASDATIVTSKDAAYAQLLTNRGVIKAGQVDQGYTGSPARFVTDPTIAQQGYATSEPYIYQHELRSWGKPVRYQLLADVGFSIYPDALSVRTGELESLAPCLTRLVPILQRAQLDYIDDPRPVNQLIADAVHAYDDGWTYSVGVADYAATTMKDLGIVANDTSGPLGGLDMQRVQSTIDTFAPIVSRSGSRVRDGLRSGDIATNRFVDPSLRLP